MLGITNRRIDQKRSGVGKIWIKSPTVIRKLSSINRTDKSIKNRKMKISNCVQNGVPSNLVVAVFRCREHFG